MAVNFLNFVKHAVCGTSKLKATTTGHIYNIRIEKDMDNGVLVAKGDYVAPEVYKANLTVTGFTGKILDKAANGNWYVEVTTPGDALLLCNSEVIYEDCTKPLARRLTPDTFFHHFFLKKVAVFEYMLYC